MAAATATVLGCHPSGVLVASTGVIGVKLDMTKVTAGVRSAASALSRGGAEAARAIMTTDPFPKETAIEVTGPSGTFRAGGIAKGAGMIEPNMATMLAFVTTDVGVAPALLQRALVEAVNDTFNAITVDGECSTNDCVFALANDASGVHLGESDYPLIVEVFRRVCEPLAIGIVRGGEGATKLVTVRVVGAASNAEARRAVRRRRQACRPRHRQLPAREDGDTRRRSELGPARCSCGTIRVGVRARPRRRQGRVDRAVRRRRTAR
jgi:glutamate N-acetyltransferase/amino-acid N-acetyltransferase